MVLPTFHISSLKDWILKISATVLMYQGHTKANQPSRPRQANQPKESQTKGIKDYSQLSNSTLTYILHQKILFLFRIKKFENLATKGFDLMEKIRFLPFARILRGPRKRPTASNHPHSIRISRKWKQISKVL